MRESEVTIYDLAKIANVSATTVSRAMRGLPCVNAKTIKKIRNLAGELGYQPNQFASNLRRKRTNLIGVMVPKLNSYFMASVLAGIEKILSEAQYDIIIAHSGESGEKEVTNANNLFHKRVDGLIVSLAYDTTDLSHFDQFIEKNIPVVFFDRVEENSTGTTVIIDNYKAGFDATQHLIDQGCKKIVHMTGNLSRNVYSKRFDGYKAALESNHIRFDKNYLIVNDLQRQTCTEAAKTIIEMNPMPDGLFVTSDFSAVICLQTFKAYGIRVPQDIAVVGFNNDIVSTIVEPNLTTIDYPGISIGEVSARIIVNHLTDKSDIKLTSSIVIQSELMIRESSRRKTN